MAQTQTLTGKVAIVTGAAQGLGEAQARWFAEHGAIVVVTDQNEPAGQAVAKSLERTPGGAVFIHHDVASEDDWKNVVQSAVERFGKVDVLVNNAGIVEIALISEMSLDRFSHVLDVNVKSAFLGCKTVLPAMRIAGGGSIVNMSSIQGMISSFAGFGSYSASKGAVRLLTKAAAVEYVQYNIRVNSVHPGGIATPLTQPYLDDPDKRWMITGRTPMGRAGRPDEVAAAVGFLASDESSYMTGSELVLDGGWLAC
jgi:cyclopentanol dehydrogenase